MDISTEITAFRDVLTQMNQVLILLQEQASRDVLASGLALYLSLTESGKSVTIVYPKQPIVGQSHLVGINKLVQKLGNKNFVISLDYVEGSIEKVSYNIEGNKFNLVIEPRLGAPVFDEKSVTFSQSGIVTDMVITLGAISLEHLGKLYQENKALFGEKPVIVFENRPTTQHFGKVNFIRPTPTLSTIISFLIRVGELPINSDIASNLYDGLIAGSRNFSVPDIDADTFDAAAWLLRNGALKRQPQRFEEMPQRETVATKAAEVPQAPPDWLKPKIYKGSSLL